MPRRQALTQLAVRLPTRGTTGARAHCPKSDCPYKGSSIAIPLTDCVASNEIQHLALALLWRADCLCHSRHNWMRSQLHPVVSGIVAVAI